MHTAQLLSVRLCTSLTSHEMGSAFVCIYSPPEISLTERIYIIHSLVYMNQILIKSVKSLTKIIEFLLTFTGETYRVLVWVVSKSLLRCK